MYSKQVTTYIKTIAHYALFIIFLVLHWQTALAEESDLANLVNSSNTTGFINSLGDTQGMTIHNSSGTSYSATGLYIIEFCTSTDCSSGCTTVGSAVLPIYTAVTIGGGSTISVGQNYLYNVALAANAEKSGISETLAACNLTSSSNHVLLELNQSTPGNFPFAPSNCCVPFTGCTDSTMKWNPGSTCTI